MSLAKAFIVSIDANRTVKDELAQAVSMQRGRRRISVTDLVNPRQAFFRWTRPDIQPPPERVQLMLSGTGFHELFGRLVSSEEYTEQFVEYKGVVGRIDVYDDVPTELKTTGSIPVDIQRTRPGYIDQLGMYCAMTGHAAGRLVIYKRAGYAKAPALKVFDVTYTDLESVSTEMMRRRDALHHALDSKDPSELSKCEWFDLDCDYRAVCGCEAALPLARIVEAGAARLEENRGLADFLSEQLRQEPKRPEGFTLNDLVFPRKAAFRRKAAEDQESVEVQDPAIETQLARLEQQGFAGTLYGALRFGVRDAFSRIPVQLGSLKGWVSTYRGVPTILRSPKFRDMVDRARLADGFPHYVDRLAFECALAGHEVGRLILYYQLLPGDKFMVYDVTFGDVTAIRAEAERRLRLLETGAPPTDLPACPTWMPKLCVYAPGCRCGESP